MLFWTYEKRNKQKLVSLTFLNIFLFFLISNSPSYKLSFLLGARPGNLDEMVSSQTPNWEKSGKRLKIWKLCCKVTREKSILLSLPWKPKKYGIQVYKILLLSINTSLNMKKIQWENYFEWKTENIRGRYNGTMLNPCL